MRRLLQVMLVLGLAGAPEAQDGPGRLLSLEPHRLFDTEQVDAEVAGRFMNNGEAAPSAVTGVELLLISFSTTAPDGAEATGVAQLFVPQQEAQPGLLAFAAGSTGLPQRCGPMHELLNTGSLETYGATALAYAGQGLTTVLPDYLGTLGEDGLQPYFVATAGATVLTDALRASIEALGQTGGDISVQATFLAGYSQGGHAVMAAADRLDTYAPDLEVGGVIGFGASGEVDVLFRNFPFTVPWAVWSYVNAFPNHELDPNEVLAPEFARTLEDDVRAHCIAAAQAFYPAEAASLYTPEFFSALDNRTLPEHFPDWADVFEANATAVNEHGLPVLFLQGTDDTVVPFQDQTDYVLRLCDQGSPVRYVNYLRTRHETRYIGFDTTLEWIRDRLAGVEAPSDCQEVRQ